MTLDEKIDEIMMMVDNAPEKTSEYDFHRTYFSKVLPKVQIDGMWTEFGVYRGRSIKTISTYASKKNAIVYGFDSFEGLPEFWDKDNPKGCYGLAGKIPDGIIDDRFPDADTGMFNSGPTRRMLPWPSNVKLVKGLFEDTLDGFLNEHKDTVAYVHIDSDIYSAAKTVLTKLKDRIVVGTVLDFDEICDYPDYRNHEIKAFAEYLLDTNRKVSPICSQRLGYSQCSFIVTE
jgi:hypothetical protein